MVKNSSTALENIHIDISKLTIEGKGNFYDRYKDQGKIGKGAYGEVKFAYDIVTREMRAMKVIPKENCPAVINASLSNEIEVLKKLDHPNIMKLFEFYQDETNYYLITEYCNGGELFERIIRIKHFTEQKAAIIMKQILSAVAYCHKLKIVHRDLKPENILFENTNKNSGIKIIDFGTAGIFHKNQKLKQCLGTVFFTLNIEKRHIM